MVETGTAAALAAALAEVTQVEGAKAQGVTAMVAAAAEERAREVHRAVEDVEVGGEVVVRVGEDEVVAMVTATAEGVVGRHRRREVNA